MKAQLTRQFTVKVIFEAPLLGFDIEKVYKKKHKDLVKELIVEAIEKDLSVIEIQKDGLIFTLESTSNLKSLTPTSYKEII